MVPPAMPIPHPGIFGGPMARLAKAAHVETMGLASPTHKVGLGATPTREPI